MRKQYDDFSQLKIKDMCKSISDMTYKYINPQTQEPTKVPAVHYEKILDQVTEKYMADITSRQFLNIMYTQLVNLKKEDPKYFNQALLCMDLGINPKDLRVPEQISLDYTTEFLDNKKAVEKKDFHMLSEDIVEAYDKSLNDPKLQAYVVKESNRIEMSENNTHRRDNWER